MQTKCNAKKLEMQPLGSRQVVCDFNGGKLTSDAGGLLLREVESRFGVIRQLSECFQDHRSPLLIEHTVPEMLSQRVYGLALGYEDLNDHDALRHDVLQGVLAGKRDPTGQDRFRERDEGKACAGRCSLQRLEQSASGTSEYCKTPVDAEAVERLFLDLFIQTREEAPEELVLDIDPTDVEIHGNQEGRHFNAHYDKHCFLPLYIFCGPWLLSARLKTSDVDAAFGTVEELERIVGRFRQEWPQVRILVRADSSFSQDKIMSWCEAAPGVDFVFGLSKNSRLVKKIAPQLEQARQMRDETGKAARLFSSFSYRTRKSWKRERRVVGKAECTLQGENPRFVVTSLKQVGAQHLYEEVYCARGEMENRLKEQQLGLFSDRVSASKLKVNQLRIWLSAAGYWLFQLFRHYALKGTRMARAQCWTIREKLLKVAARIRVSVRRVYFSLSEEFPAADVFVQAWANLASA